MAQAPDTLLRQRAALEAWGRTCAANAPQMRSICDGTIDLPGGIIPTLTLTPQTVASHVQHLFVHGGAWCMGSSRVFQGLLARMADQCQRPILSVDYPLAPEYPYPAAIDAVAAVIDIVAGRSGVGGLIAGSAGCHIALAALLRHRASPLPNGPRAAILWNPALAQTTQGWSHSAFGTGSGLTATDLDTAIAHYAVPPDDPLADLPGMDLSGLPPIWIACGDRDPLLDDSLRFFRRLILSDVDAHLNVVPGATHGFMNRWFADPPANAAVSVALDWLEARCRAAR